MHVTVTAVHGMRLPNSAPGQGTCTRIVCWGWQHNLLSFPPPAAPCVLTRAGAVTVSIPTPLPHPVPFSRRYGAMESPLPCTVSAGHMQRAFHFLSVVPDLENPGGRIVTVEQRLERAASSIALAFRVAALRQRRAAGCEG